MSLWQMPDASTLSRTCVPVGCGVGPSTSVSGSPHWQTLKLRMATPDTLRGACRRTCAGRRSACAGACEDIDQITQPGNDLPPQRCAGAGPGLAVVGHLPPIEGAVERGEDAPLGEVERGRLAVARPRQVGDDLLVDAARP